MSENKQKAKIPMRRIVVRAVLVALYFGLMALAVVTGKVHTILVDNKDSGELAAFDGVMVSVDGKEALELYPGDRDRVIVKGQSHKVSIETFDGTKAEKSFTLPFKEDMVLLSAPKVAAGQEPFWEHFVPLNAAPAADEPVGNENAFTAPEAVPALGEPAPAPASP